MYSKQAGKIILTMLAVGITVILGRLVYLSIEAKKLDAGWSKKLPFDKPFEVIDGRPSLITGPANHRFAGIYKGESGDMLWKYALELEAKGHIVKTIGTSIDGRTIAVGSSAGKIFIFDRYANPKGSFKPSVPVSLLAVSGDGRRIGQITNDGRILLSDTSGGNIKRLDAGESPLLVKLDKNGDRLLVSTPNSLRFLAEDGKAFWSKSLRVKKVSVSNRGELIGVLTKNGALNVYDRLGRLKWRYARDRLAAAFDWIAVSGAGRYVAAGSNSRGSLYVFSKSGKLINTYEWGAANIAFAAFAGNGRLLIAGGTGIITAFRIDRALEAASRLDRSVKWAVPRIIAMILFMTVGLFVLRRRSLQSGLGEKIDFLPPKQAKRSKKTQKAA